MQRFRSAPPIHHGWFNRTLPGELAALPDGPDRQVLVHIDADLHASALYCLTTLGAALGGFLVMFDEYGAGEARALRDVLDAWGSCTGSTGAAVRSGTGR